MNHTISRWLRLCTLTAALAASAPFAAARQDPPKTARGLYDQGVELYQKGRILEAKDILLRVDVAQLDRAQRTDVLTLIDRITEQLQDMPVIQLHLQKAALHFTHDDWRQATTHAQAVLKSEDAADADRAEANALLEKIGKAQAALRPRISGMLGEAVTAFDAKEYASSMASLQAIHNSGIALTLDQQTQVNTYMEKIMAIEASRGAKFDLPSVNLGAMAQAEAQPANPAAEPPPAQPENPPAEPPVAEEEVPPANNDLLWQAQQAEATALLTQAHEAHTEGRYAAALALYHRVLIIQPDNQEAINGRDQCETLLNQGPIISETTQNRQVLREQTIAEYRNLLEEARSRRDEGNFPAAVDMVSRAKVKLVEGRAYLSATEYEDMRAEAMNLGVEIFSQQQEAADRNAVAQSDELNQRRMMERMSIEQERQTKINEKLMTIRRLQEAQKYEECIQELESLLFIDPNNVAASTLRDILQDLLIYREFDEIKRDSTRLLAKNSIDMMRASKFPRGIVDYPEDWPNLTSRRAGEGMAFLDSEADRKVWEALATRRLPVNFAGNAFGDVMAHIGEVAGINVDVDWNALESDFIDRNTPINLKFNDSIPLEVVLRRVLAQLGDSDETRPSYAIADGILTISTPERLQRNPVTHVYDIRDLLIDVPDFDSAPDFDLDSVVAESSGDSRGSWLFGEPRTTDGEAYDANRVTREEMIERLREVITSTINPRSWEVNGGEIGVIQELNGNFIITSTVRNHRDISNLLAKLREIRSLQISVESRFLLVSEEFFEQIGIDLDIFWGGGAFNRDSKEDTNLLPSDLFVDRTAGSVVRPSAQRQYFSLFELVPAVDENGAPILDANRRQLIDQLIPDAGIFQQGRQTFGPWSMQQDSLGLAEQLFGADASTLAGRALGATPAFTYGITYLDEVQVDLLIKATQADRRNVQLTAPKLTFFNGQRSFVQVTTSQFFVSDLQPVVGDSSAGFDPTLSPLREGVVLDVEGTVSADRRYVTMTVLTSLAKILDIQTTSVPIVVGGQVVQSGDPNAILSQTAFIERPRIQISRVNTTVTVPDKGTILLGGQSLRNEIEIETGVPVLSKLPIVNRFFTNRLTTTTENTLMILLKPTVILQQENEELLFPGLNDAVYGGSSFGTSY